MSVSRLLKARPEKKKLESTSSPTFSSQHTLHLCHFMSGKGVGVPGYGKEWESDEAFETGVGAQTAKGLNANLFSVPLEVGTAAPRRVPETLGACGRADGMCLAGLAPGPGSGPPPSSPSSPRADCSPVAATG